MNVLRLRKEHLQILACSEEEFATTELLLIHALRHQKDYWYRLIAETLYDKIQVLIMEYTPHLWEPDYSI